ncbi:hypothetical protein BH11PSE5_BH11PSE5_26310 [soil metagenome]|jgi:hypothetical protein|uniref:PilZ domain-containing protein n=1 Tax=unclassified Sphingobium TaxID=2611147 RepID=UPI001E439E5D|nr:MULTISPECIES: PilZ domain-containing protein [unclassified Sphingobium]GLI98319.1 hypothetical protein Sbs19_21370 [Sphingobium sp. BS19]CAH0350527.1 hypothetical protein SPH9361_01218 [Sphingobium sp. CECT 9361]
MTINVEDADDRGPARGARRDSLFLLTVISDPDGRAMGSARVRNLSATGLMADCEKPFSVGDRISTKLRGVGEVTGKITWVKDDRVGVSFDAPIDPKLARRAVAAPQSTLPGYLRPTITLSRK